MPVNALLVAQVTCKSLTTACKAQPPTATHTSHANFGFIPISAHSPCNSHAFVRHLWSGLYQCPLHGTGDMQISDHSMGSAATCSNTHQSCTFALCPSVPSSWRRSHANVRRQHGTCSHLQQHATVMQLWVSCPAASSSWHRSHANL